MDPLGAPTAVMEVNSLTRWADLIMETDPLTKSISTVFGNDLPNAHSSPPFSVRPDLNAKLALW